MKMVKFIHKITAVFSEYNTYLRQSKELRKKVRLFHKKDMYPFFLTAIYGFSCFVAALIIGRFNLFSDSLLRAVVIFALLYSFLLFITVSFMLPLIYVMKTSFTNDLFYSQWKIYNDLGQIPQNRDLEKIKKFQKRLNYFDRRFSIVFGNYFKNYDGYVKPKQVILRDCYYHFDKILNVVALNAEINSNKIKDLLIDFQEYIENMKGNLLIPLLERTILLSDASLFFKTWDSHFNFKYKQRYKESNKYLDEFIEKIHTRNKFRQEIKYKIFTDVIPVILSIILSLILVKIFGITV